MRKNIETKGGYWGKILRVDLTIGKVNVETFDDTFARKYLGGVGFAAKIISDGVTRNIAPLSPGNILVFATGPYQAANIASGGRWAAAARSPLTGYWGESNCGGHGGPMLKCSGFDAVVITGRAKQPVYLWIHDEKAEILDGTALWGMDTCEVVDAIREALGESRASIAAIGPAGENLVNYACIANDKHAFFGQCGIGAVMGSKNLKAIAIYGKLKPPIADPEKLKKVYRDILENKIRKADFTKENREHGMANAVVPREENALLPIKNWQQDEWPQGAKKIGAPYYTEYLKIKPWACTFCVMGCHRKITNPKFSDKVRETSGPEYETLAELGAMLLIDDLDALVNAGALCNRYGIDTIELGGILGWAFESFEKGMLTKKDTDGIELTWGNTDALLKMIEKVKNRDGFGSIVAEGIRACVQKWSSTKPYAVETYGKSLPAHDPRAFFAQTITSIASTRGACHIHGFAEAVEVGVLLPELGMDKKLGRFEWEKKGLAGAIYQDIQQFWNSLICCFFYAFSDVTLTDFVNILNAITGWDVSPEEARKIGERIVCLQHCFSLGVGLVPQEENVMPERLEIPHRGGDAAGKVPPWQKILKDYWMAKGWVAGIPKEEKLIELGLNDVARHS